MAEKAQGQHAEAHVKKTPGGRERRSNPMWLTLLLLALAVLLAAALLILPPSAGKVSPVLTDDGRPAENGIAEKIWLPVNGVQQGMILRSGDRTRPVLLFLNGGPGIPDYFLARDAGLEQLFTVCYWDYRGTGLSYSPEIRPEDCTTEQFVQDALAVTDALRTRFGQDRIYLMGHSYGTFIGLLCAQAAPEKYHAYIAMSQIADQPRSELTALHAMEQAAQRQGDRRTAERLAQYDTETADAAWLRRWFSEPERDRVMHTLGGGTTAQMRSVISGIFFPTLRCTDYTQTERINIWRGKALLQSAPTAYDRMEFSAADAVPSLELPVYFFAGENDLTCCYAVQRDYFDRLAAPEKGFYTFSGCAHSPLFESPAQALRILREDVLTGRFMLADGAGA